MIVSGIEIQLIERLFEENTFDTWVNLERNPHFSDLRFKKEKLPLGMGWQRSSITEEMMMNPFMLYDFIYGLAQNSSQF